jgi:hypothetical protein
MYAHKNQELFTPHFPKQNINMEAYVEKRKKKKRERERECHCGQVIEPMNFLKTKNHRL